jgi:hypothetical protein
MFVFFLLFFFLAVAAVLVSFVQVCDCSLLTLKALSAVVFTTKSFSRVWLPVG